MTESTAPAPSDVQPAARNTKALVLSFASTIVFDIGLTILIFSVARSHGASETASYLWASIGPLLGMASEWLRTRQFGGASLIILVVTLLSALVALIGANTPIWLLLKDAILSGAFGVVILLSALPVFPKPLMFYFGQKFGTDGSAAGIRYWRELWDRYPAFRRSQYVIDLVWGIGLSLEAGLKVVAAFTLPFDTAFAVNQIAPFVVLAGLITWTIWYGQLQRKRGEARRRAAEAAASH